MTTYSNILAATPKPEPNQSGLRTLSFSTDTTLNLVPHARLPATLEAAATVGSLTLTLPDTAAQEQGFDFLLVNVGAEEFTCAGRLIEKDATYWGYIDGSDLYRLYRTGRLNAPEISALAGFALTASSTQLLVNVTPLAGNGLTGTGAAALNFNPDNSTIEVVSDQVRVKPLGITAAQIANTTITPIKFVSPPLTLQKVQQTNPTLASGATMTLLTPGRTIATQFVPIVQVIEFVGSERRIAKETDYRINYGLETQISVTKLSVGTAQVLVSVAYEG